MIIDESRPNIWVVDASTSSQPQAVRDKYPNNPQNYNNQQNYFPGYPNPIIGPNPLPPFVIGSGGYQNPYNPSPTQESQSQALPTSPPPSFTPQKQQKNNPSLYKIDAGGIKGCLYHWVYIWPMNGGRGYWLFLTYVGRKSIAGYRFNGHRYVYGGVDLDSIESFECY